MTKSKKLTSLAACAIMAVSSMAAVSVNASAAEVLDEPAAVSDTSFAESYVNPSHQGAYYNGTSFIQITSSECNFYKVDYAGYNDICGYTSSFSVGTTGGSSGSYSFSASFSSGNWYYYDSRGNIVHPNSSLYVYGTYNTNGTITVSGVSYTK